MSHGNLPCPECETMNDAPEKGTKKITCSSCGVILVLNKVYGDNWPAQAKKHAGAAAEAPSKPKIVSRKPKGRSSDEGEAKPSRKSRGSSSKRKSSGRSAPVAAADSEDQGRKTRGRKKQGEGFSNGVIIGSFGAFVVIVILVFMVYKGKQDEKAKEEQAAIELTEKTAKEALAKAKAEAEEIEAADAAEETGAVAEKVDEKPVAVKKKPAKKKLARRKRDPFPEPTLTPEIADAFKKAMAILQDPDTTSTRRAADDSLFEHRKEAIPILINRLMAIDSRNEAESRGAYGLIESLRRCSEFSTKYDRNLLITSWPTDEKELDSNAKEREIVVLDWWKWWNKNKDTWKPPVDSEEDF
ncbi:MAG: hypothetical protein ACI97A_003898 [Planctomycetota bacterium]|jgi:hypothetical protein